MALADVADGADGWLADTVLGAGANHGCGFEDVMFLPAPQQGKEKVEKLQSRFSKNISLFTPIVGPSCPNVTGDRMGIALALAGGIGIIHKQQSIQNQAAMVKRVKEFETAFVLNPCTLGPRATIQDAENIMNQVGCSCVPVTDGGTMGGKLIGLLTRRDLDALDAQFQESRPSKDACLNQVMIHINDIITAMEPITFREAQDLMRKNKVGKLPVVNSERELVALVCRGDSKRVSLHPNASRDPNTQLLVAASVAVDEEVLGDGLGWDRVVALVEAGADALVVETDAGVSEATIHFVKRIRASYLTTDVLCGRVSSVRQAEDLCNLDIDGLIVGASQGLPGVEEGGSQRSGEAEASTLYRIASMARLRCGIPVVADGGIKSASDVVKAFCLGASTVSPGPLLARTESSPGESVHRGGIRIKLRRALECESGHVPWPTQGLEGSAVDCGSAEELIDHLLPKIKDGLRSLGLKGLIDVPPALSSGAVRLESIRPLGDSSNAAGRHVRSVRLVTSALFNQW